MTKVRIPVHVRAARTDRHEPAPVRAHTEAASQKWARSVPDPEAHDCPGQQDLLQDVLSIADDLARALAAADEGTPIREGVAITHRGVLRILRKHGLERVQAEAQPFDPHWHEAIDVVPADRWGVDAGTVVEVLSAGYRRGTQLFRPARVVVAQ